ncbi:DUF433 domain-containing protein [Phenylobacterium sp.]|uniref:DUF433 domain-containing protein n=1 Tax=Phenylobacterium sp. TaxID=1871053 RepID=UPI0025F3ED05|nr:DUF433 domain-containing protein [Phenylobacterium sp.]MBX3484272.1 DUF433 domain-containing protein [Phenylobacterium sp.]MCW5758534.1 DUF433 domain-containing protein [Phenylobacterium sp.]
MRTQFTPREIAELSGAPKSAVEKAIEEKVFTAKRVRRGRRERRVLPAHAVAYVRIVRSVKYRMDPAMKRRLAAALSRLGRHELRTWRFELEPAVEMDVGRLVGDAMDRAAAYGAARERLIVEDEDVLGGTPVIRGTRISVYSILGRIADGDTVADILSDYPELTAEAVEAAAIFARSHPLVGRPAGRPWSTAA